jgi:hypothetical protein
MRADRPTLKRLGLPALCILAVLLVGFADSLADQAVPWLVGVDNFLVVGNPDAAPATVRRICYTRAGSETLTETFTLPELQSRVDPLPAPDDFGHCVVQNFSVSGSLVVNPIYARNGRVISAAPAVKDSIGNDGSAKVVGGPGLNVTTFAYVFNRGPVTTRCDFNVGNNQGGFTQQALTLTTKSTALVNLGSQLQNGNVAVLDTTCTGQQVGGYTVIVNPATLDPLIWEPIVGEEGSQPLGSALLSSTIR